MPLAVTPAPEQPRAVPHPLALALTWLSLHRVALALLTLAALGLLTVGGYAGTCLLVRLCCRGRRVDWRRLLTGIGWVNALSCLSALIPVPAIVLQIAHVGLWRPLNAVTLPLGVAVGAWVAVPAWHAVRATTGLGRVRAALVLALPAGAMLALLAGAAVLGLRLAVA